MSPIRLEDNNWASLAKIPFHTASENLPKIQFEEFVYSEWRAVTLQEIGQRVQAGLKRDPELLAVISADDHAIHGSIVDIMDKVRLAGISRLAIAVKLDRRGQP